MLPKICHFFLLSCAGIYLLLMVEACLAQQTPSSTPSLPLNIQPERAGEREQKFPEIPLQQQTQPAPDIPLPPPPSAPKDNLSGVVQVKVNKIKLTGNTIFSDQELAPLIKPYEHRTINSDDLFTLRNALTLFYTKAGYLNSGAIIPDQKVVDGIIEIKIIEGRLTKINVIGDHWLRDSYITSRLRIGNERILNIKQLQQRIKLLYQDRLIKRINAELTPGKELGESVLNLKVEENRIYSLGVDFSNSRTPSIGELQGEIYGSIYNLTGLGDAVSTRYSLTEGLDNIFASYSAPITAYDTRLKFFYEQSDANITEQPFDILKIESKNKNYGIALSHPFFHTPQDQLLLSIAFERRLSDVTFQPPGQPREPFPSQVENGKTRLSIFRFFHEWVHHSSNQVIAFRSTYSWGLNVSALLQSNNNGIVERINDKHFFSWRGDFQWLQRLTESNILMLLRVDVQLTPDLLLPIEKLSIGGARTVRGYRENQMIRDNGAVASIEFRVPIFNLQLPWLNNSSADGDVQLASFYNFGWGENTIKDNSEVTNTLSSAGIGIRWDPTSKIHSELYWAIPFRHITTAAEHSLQDDGIHFLLNITLL